MGVSIEACVAVEQSGWLPLREALWPHCTKREHLSEMAAFVAAPERFVQFVAYADRQQPLGFIEAALRNDYVNGCETSTVAFVEGLYVVPANRRRGVARDLVAAVAGWAAARGCRELASDASIRNTLSHRVHRALGFGETERVVFFRKLLGVK